MSGYIQAGYLVTLIILGGYAVTLVVRERSARRRFVQDDRAHAPASIAPVTREETGDGADK